MLQKAPKCSKKRPCPGGSPSCILLRTRSRPQPGLGGDALKGLGAPLKGSGMRVVLGCLGALASRLSNGPYWASSGLLLGLIGDSKWTY